MAAKHALQVEMEKAKNGRANVPRLKELKAALELAQQSDVAKFKAEGALHEAKQDIEAKVQSALDKADFELMGELQTVLDALNRDDIGPYNQWKVAVSLRFAMKNKLVIMKITAAMMKICKFSVMKNFVLTHFRPHAVGRQRRSWW